MLEELPFWELDYSVIAFDPQLPWSGSTSVTYASAAAGDLRL